MMLIDPLENTTRGSGIIYLKKANSDLIDFCDCDDGLIRSPGQMECPWCGCGWLFTSITCRKAFTFAVAVELETGWQDLAKRDLQGFGVKDPSKKDINDWITPMKQMLENVKLGQIYAYIDGCVFQKNSTNIKFEGLYARHKFTQLPHTKALSKPLVEKQVLSNPTYWQQHKNEI